MKILIYPNELTIGGSAINAIDLACAIGDLGHEIIVYARPGPLEDYIESKGLLYIPARLFKYRPAPNRVVQLASLAHKEKVDVIHTYEWPSCVDAFFGAGMFLRVPVVCTVLSMSVAPILPRVLPLIMGTEELAELAQAKHRATVTMMEPPIDTEADSPDNDGIGFRTAYGIERDDFLVITVSRLSIDLKLDALVDAIDAVDILATSSQVKLIVVGDGEAAHSLRRRASLVNQRHGREVVSLVGPLLDPRPAYAAADVVVGMGSSALRGLAHGKPVVVQGELGFNAPFDELHQPQFLRTGFFGVGDGTSGGPRLADHIATLLDDSARREVLGAYGRDVVVRRYGLKAAAMRLLEIYQQAVAERPPQRAVMLEALRSAWIALSIEFHAHLPSTNRIHKARNLRKLSDAAKPSDNPG